MVKTLGNIPHSLWITLGILCTDRTKHGGDRSSKKANPRTVAESSSHSLYRLLNDFNLDTGNGCEIPKDPSSSDRMKASYRDEIPESILIRLNLCSDSSSSKQAFPRTNIHIRCRSRPPKDVKATKYGMKDLIDCDRLPLALRKKTFEGESIITLGSAVLFREWIEVTSLFLSCNESAEGVRKSKSVSDFVTWRRWHQHVIPPQIPVTLIGTRHSPNNRRTVFFSITFLPVLRQTQKDLQNKEKTHISKITPTRPSILQVDGADVELS